MKVTLCDLCKTNRADARYKLVEKRYIFPHTTTEKDVCYFCVSKLLDWKNGGKNNEETRKD